MKIVRPTFSAEDLRWLGGDGKRYEVLEWELVVTPAPSLRQQKVAKAVYRRLALWEDRGLGLAFFAPLNVAFDQDTVVQPDLLFVRTERLWSAWGVTC